jgi:hypothetical protein
MIRCIEIALSIPDNEARTALATLERLGVPAAALVRADLYRCDVDDAHADELPQTLRAFETIFNPNKHVLRDRGSGPHRRPHACGRPVSRTVYRLATLCSGRRAGGSRRGGCGDGDVALQYRVPESDTMT